MRRLHLPSELGRRIQALFLLMSLFNVVGSVPRVVRAAEATDIQRIAATVSVAFLVGWWARGYRRHRLPAWGIPLEGVALGAVAVAQHDYVATLGILFSSMSYRGLFGTWRHVCGFVVAAYAGTAGAVAVVQPGSIGPFLVQSAGVPALAFFTALVALNTRRQEEASARERTFARVGAILAATPDPELIHRTTAEAAVAMLGSEPSSWAAIYTASETSRPPVVHGDVPDDPATAPGTVSFPLETDKRTYGRLIVHGPDAQLQASRTSLSALAGQCVLGLVNADHAADLRHLAFHDPLTGLANRALLHEHLDRALARHERGAPLAVLLIDLDGFKSVNDTYGHATGDFLLVTVAGRLRDAVRGADTPARLGGDEFAVVLEGMDSAGDALGVAQRVLGALQAPLMAGDIDITPRGSIGVAIADQHRSADALLQEADLAMYAAKRAGKGCVAHHSPEGQAHVSTATHTQPVEA